MPQVCEARARLGEIEGTSSAFAALVGMSDDTSIDIGARLSGAPEGAIAAVSNLMEKRYYTREILQEQLSKMVGQPS